MADNAPFSVNRPPFPNVVNLLQQGRVEQHIITFSLATGSVPTVDQTRSSAGVAAADGGAGLVNLTFPPGGTGAIGWVQLSSPAQTTVTDLFFNIDNDGLNFVTGTCQLTAVLAGSVAADTAVVQSITAVINVIKAPAV